MVQSHNYFPHNVVLGNAFNYRHVKSVDLKACLVRLSIFQATPTFATQEDTVELISLQSPQTLHIVSIVG